jgi:hypothetical protein
MLGIAALTPTYAPAWGHWRSLILSKKIPRTTKRSVRGAVSLELKCAFLKTLTQAAVAR